MNTADWAGLAILWLVFACITAPFIGRFLRAGAREMPPAPGRGDPSPGGHLPGAGPEPPEWEPDDSEAQLIAELFAEAAAEEDHRHD